MAHGVVTLTNEQFDELVADGLTPIGNLAGAPTTSIADSR